MINLLAYAAILFDLVLSLCILGTFIKHILLNPINAFETNTSEKHEVYECGFDPIDNARTPVNIRFYMYGLIFLVFDIEIMFIFPWVASNEIVRDLENNIMLILLLLITLSLAYEWLAGALEWI